MFANIFSAEFLCPRGVIATWRQVGMGFEAKSVEFAIESIPASEILANEQLAKTRLIVFLGDLQHMQEMGYPRHRSMLALMQTASLEHALDAMAGSDDLSATPRETKGAAFPVTEPHRKRQDSNGGVLGRALLTQFSPGFVKDRRYHLKLYKQVIPNGNIQLACESHACKHESRHGHNTHDKYKQAITYPPPLYCFFVLPR
jgi:hypothetical protein